MRASTKEYADENPWKAGIAQVTGSVAGAVGAAPAATKLGIKAATTLRGKAAQLAGGGAVAGGVEGFGSGSGGFESRVGSAGTGAAVGAAFAPLVGLGMAKIGQVATDVGGKALRRVFTSRQFYNQQTGELTDAGKKRLATLGYSDLDALSREMQTAFGIAAEKTRNAPIGPETAQTASRIANAERFNVPLTPGQATGDVAQSAFEENARAGTRGPGASNTILGFDNVQRGAVDAARNDIVPTAGEVAGDRIDAAEAVISGVRREAETARQAGSQAYKALEDTGAALDGKAFPYLRERIESGVGFEGVALDAGTPNAQAALGVLESAFQGAERGGVPFKSIERARQRMLMFQRAAKSGSNGPDQVAIDAVVREFDGWLDDTITDALIAGDSAVIGKAKDARALWAKYRSTFLGKEGTDKFIRKIVEDDLAPDQVAGWLFGASNNIGGGQSSLVVKRVKNILGENSPEFQEVRRAAWDRITQATEGRDAYGPQRMASNISEFLDGKGKTLARELFSERDRAVMAQYRDMLKVLVPPKKATNPSGTSYDIQRAVGEIQKGMGMLLGGATGGPIGAAAGREAVETGGNFSATLKARAAAKGFDFKRPSTAGAVGSGVGVGAQAQNAAGREPLRIEVTEPDQ
ncbi:hypothetical protein [Oceaniglobus trochenteri]|uniref:hypothetical protein n=1 Tax=Oceaniglobus trochenteri TaxID=2763260 RepID=UPI001CFF657A|nr:hypothetical protein [Oceaniglobus trochenteri]